MQDIVQSKEVDQVRYTVPQATSFMKRSRFQESEMTLVRDDLKALSLELDYLGFPYFGVGRISSTTGVNVEGNSSWVVGSMQAADGEKVAVVPGNPGGSAGNVALDAPNLVGDDIDPVVGDDVVPAKKAKGKRKITDEGASSKQPVTEKKCVGSGLLRGYILKMDSEEKTESSYDFVNYSWVDPSIMETISIYRSSKETVAFTEEYDFVRKDFKGTVECSCHPGRKLLESLTSSYKKFKDHFFRLRSEEGTVAFYKDKDGSDAFPLYWSPRSNAILDVDPIYFSESELAEIRYLENRVPLKCSKLIELEGELEKLKKYIVKMSPKLDKSAMARRIAEKKRAAEKAQTSTEEVSKKRKKGKVADEIHNISDDDNRDENIVDVFQEFVGSSPEVRSLWDSRFEFGNMIDATCSLPGDQNQLDKWGPRLAHVMLQIQGIRSAFLGRYLELQYINGLSDVDTLWKRVTDLEKDLSGVEELRTKVASQMKSDKEVAEAALLQEKAEHEVTKSKSAADRDQLTAEAADSYDFGFNQALEQVNIFYPDVDTSVFDVLKEVVGGVLVDLISGENEPHVESGQTDALVETVAEKVTFEGEREENEPTTEVLGNAPRI
ncbi:hypothetical protein SESBI_39847 [Sesbania bispinosa]|nr:hypothetical protein SESBI_39847 [Sesbania bispinosa]